MNIARFVLLFVQLFYFANLINAQVCNRSLDPTTTYYWYYDDSLPTNGIKDANLNTLSESSQKSFVRSTVQSVLNSFCSYSERSSTFQFVETSSSSSTDLVIRFGSKTELAGCDQISGVPNGITFSSNPQPQGATGVHYWTNSISTWDPRNPVYANRKYDPFLSSSGS